MGCNIAQERSEVSRATWMENLSDFNMNQTTAASESGLSCLQRSAAPTHLRIGLTLALRKVKMTLDEELEMSTSRFSLDLVRDKIGQEPSST